MRRKRHCTCNSAVKTVIFDLIVFRFFFFLCWNSVQNYLRDARLPLNTYINTFQTWSIWFSKIFGRFSSYYDAGTRNIVNFFFIFFFSAGNLFLSIEYATDNSIDSTKHLRLKEHCLSYIVGFFYFQGSHECICNTMMLMMSFCKQFFDLDDLL